MFYFSLFFKLDLLNGYQNVILHFLLISNKKLILTIIWKYFDLVLSIKIPLPQKITKTVPEANIKEHCDCLMSVKDNPSNVMLLKRTSFIIRWLNIESYLNRNPSINRALPKIWKIQSNFYTLTLIYILWHIQQTMRNILTIDFFYENGLKYMR